MNDTETPNLEVLAPSAVESLERAAIDVQVSTAHAYPRSLKKFQTRALDMATIDEETAESCIYVRPVGGGKFAEGASIRLAEIVAASYGNLRVAARIIEQTPRFVRCEGVAHDLETNYAGKSEVIEATLKKDGTPYDERMRVVIAKACLAKAYRDAVFKVVPKALCKQVIEAAKKITNGTDKPVEERRKKAQAWVSTLKIDEKRVFTALGVQGWPEVGNDQLATLTGLKTSIADKDVTIDEAFPAADQMKGASAPSMFAAGEGKPAEQKPADPVAPTPASTAATPEQEKLIELRQLMEKASIKEATVITHMRALGIADESLSTLDEVCANQPSAIAAVLASWKTTVKDLKKAQGLA
jgi:hypothetical protein